MNINFINYFSSLAMPLIILIIVIYGLIERNKIFDTFLIGAKEGINIVINIFPTLVGLFVAIRSIEKFRSFRLYNKNINAYIKYSTFSNRNNATCIN